MMMDDPFDFRGMNQRSSRVVESAKRAALGLPKEQLVPGAVVTISPCRCTGDRSYSHDRWEIVARNEGHVSIKKITTRENDHFAGPHIICIHEHEFYGAEHMDAA